MWLEPVAGEVAKLLETARFSCRLNVSFMTAGMDCVTGQRFATHRFNNNTGTQNRDSMLGYRQFPTDLFTGQVSSIESLHSLMMDGFSGP